MLMFGVWRGKILVDTYALVKNLLKFIYLPNIDNNVSDTVDLFDTRE